MDIVDRVNYYLGVTKDKKWNIVFDEDFEIFRDTDTGKEYEDNYSEFYSTFCLDKNSTSEKFKQFYINNTTAKCTVQQLLGYWVYYCTNYVEPMIKLFNSDAYLKEKKIIFRPGDVYFHTDVPIITKTRPLGKSYNILINLDAERHWNELKTVDKYDISFKDKNNKIIWRGCLNGFIMSTTRPSRLTLCNKYDNHENKMIDIGSIEDVNSVLSNKIIKQHISVAEQLQSKFIISLEGGDVATNLKWILYSNSVVIMPNPTMCGWLMEDKLEPCVHYVPLEKDFDDIEEKYTWCLNNLDKCEEIAKNGKKYIEKFLDKDKEKHITNMVLRAYLDNVTII